MNSSGSSHTHCQAPQAQAQTKACQRVCLPQPRENFKIFLPLFKEKIKTRQRTTDPDKNESIDKFNMKVQFDPNTRTDKNRQSVGGNAKKTTQTVIKTESNSDTDKLVKNLIHPYLQAHCQSLTRQRFNQSFVFVM